MSCFAELGEKGPFDLILADPPWQFQTRSAKGITSKGAGGQYRTMDLDAIKALPVAELAAPDCLLWLCATNPMLPQALEVMAAWGFAFRTAGTWVKRSRLGKPAFGTGYILRSANEPFLIGVRGRPVTTRVVRSAVPSWDDGAHAVHGLPVCSITIEACVRGHSRKPDEAFAAAELLMPQARRLELFSRQRRSGWVCWGDEVERYPEVKAE